MSVPKTFRNKLAQFTPTIVGVTAMLVILIIGGLGIAIHSTVSHAIIEQIDRDINQTGHLATDNIHKWLDGRKLLVSALAGNLATNDTAPVSALLNNEALNNTFNPVYFGDQAGVFTRYPISRMSPSYDPRKRPWYIAAANAKHLVLTKPYISASTGLLVMTIAAPVIRNGVLVGVAGADLNSDTLTKFLGDLDLGGKGYAFLVDADGTVLVHPDHKKVMKKLEGEHRFDNQKIVSIGNTDAAEFTTFYPIDNLSSAKWYVGVTVDRTKAMMPLGKTSLLLLTAFLIALLVIVSLLGLLTWRLAIHRREMTRLNEELADQAGTDALTGCANRRRFLAMLDAERQRAMRYETSFCVISVDLDFFKLINDQYGHAGGDEALRHFSNTTKNIIRATDLIGRLGGEEFVVLLRETTIEKAAILAERLRARIESSPTQCSGQEIQLTVSCGIAQWRNEETMESLLDRSDKALYQAKTLGRNRVCQEPQIADPLIPSPRHQTISSS